METISYAHALVHVVNDVTPLGFCVLLAVIIFLLVWKKGPIGTLSNNHLSGLPEMQSSLKEISGSMKTLVVQGETAAGDLAAIRDGINEVKGRLHG